jgi:hypothetical protein
MQVVPVCIAASVPCFDQASYHAPANESFAIKITNSAFTLSGEPLRATVAISRSDNPARAPDPERPHIWYYSADRLIFRAPAVEAPTTNTVVVPALESGDYLLQLEPDWDHQSNAALMVW